MVSEIGAVSWHDRERALRYGIQQLESLIERLDLATKPS
jgi:hypothetical protein